MAAPYGTVRDDISVQRSLSDGNSSSLRIEDMDVRTSKRARLSHQGVSNQMDDDLIRNEDYEETFAQLKMQLNPTIFVLHPNIITNRGLLEIIQQGLDGAPNVFEYRVLKSSAWNEKSCKALIHNALGMKKHGKELTKSEVYYTLSSCVDLENPYVVQALGGLLHYLQDHVFNLDEGRIVVNGCKELPNARLLRIDSNSLFALQIFNEEFHPNWLKGAGKSKEGYSLFSMFDRAHSIPGRLRLRDWMHRPLCDKEAILGRQRVVAFTSDARHQDMITDVVKQLKHFHDMARIILRIKKVQANYLDWCKINTSLTAAVAIVTMLRDYMHNLRESSDEAIILMNLCKDIDLIGLNDVKQHLQEWIDFDETLKAKEVIIHEGKDSVLDEKRDIYRDLEGYLVQAAEQVLESTPVIEALSVEYVPQLGYLVVVDDADVAVLRSGNWINDNKSVSSIVGSAPPSRPSSVGTASYSGPHPSFVDPGSHFVFVFAHEGKHFFKHRVVYQLDELIGDVKSDIQDRMRQILLELEEGLLDLESSIVQTTASLATLDAFISLGVIAREFNLSVPQIHDDPVIVIKGGRHLLQELVVDSFVPNDAILTPDKNVALVTGPNSSGKSIYLKQVGIVVYLAHIGSFVPCEQAIIGLTDKILTRIKTTESVSVPQSSFTIDLTQMCKILKYRTNRSLCLIDEFGKGTNPADGLALLAAIIEDFTERKSNAIFVLHFTEILFDHAIKQESMNSINCFRMETLEKKGAEDGECTVEDLVPLYKLKYGVETTSKGILCAARMGMDNNVIERAGYFRDCMATGKPATGLKVVADDEEIDPKSLELAHLFLSVENWETADDEVLARLESLVSSID
eukprot:gene27365-33054_t